MEYFCFDGILFILAQGLCANNGTMIQIILRIPNRRREKLVISFEQWKVQNEGDEKIKRLKN